MGSFVFKWAHPAKEVFVTGTFDDWGKTVQLDKKGDIFEKDVEISKVDEKIYYKFVVDGTWTTDHTAPQEDDGHANVNNVLIPENIKKPSSHTEEAVAGGAGGAAAAGTGAAFLSGAHPDSTTAQMASEVPKEGESAPTVSSAAPESTTADLAKDAPLEKQQSPPGGFPETPANEEKNFSVNPIPASEGIGNPVNVPAGEKLPESQGNIHSSVTTSKEDYEKAGSAALPAAAAGVAGTGGAEADKNFSLPEKSSNMIPESSLPIESASPHIQSAGADSSTAKMAGEQPIEPRSEASVVDGSERQTTTEVPEVVKESIQESEQGPEATTNSEAVAEKSAVESELMKEVKETNATGEPAPTAAAATSETAPAPTATESAPAEAPKAEESKPTAGTFAALEAPKHREQERELSPMSKDPDMTNTAAATSDKPTVTTGVGSAKTDTKSTPASSTTPTPESAAAKKKKNRASGFFGKLKERFK